MNEMDAISMVWYGIGILVILIWWMIDNDN